ncbi:uncharacterized protein [Musca autumnalis]|uniref:uncharacterized protein n=1 Tax=Musca autumnalis TaxID=221902 RepID=UPI003CEEC201
MEPDSPNTQKFKNAKKKFRAHWEKVEAQRRRTIWLDEGPSTSQASRGKTFRKPTPKTPHQKAVSPSQHIFYRMEHTQQNEMTDEPAEKDQNESCSYARESRSQNHETQANMDVPRTPTYTKDAESPRSNQQASVVGTPANSVCSEIPITPGKGWYHDSDDESTIARTITEESETETLGEMDEGADQSLYSYLERSVTRRTPSPESSSAEESEDEDDYVPTPPRRHGLALVRQQDREYPYLGYRCIERTVTVRLLVPDSGGDTVYAIDNTASEAPLDMTGNQVPVAEEGTIKLKPDGGTCANQGQEDSVAMREGMTSCMEAVKPAVQSFVEPPTKEEIPVPSVPIPQIEEDSRSSQSSFETVTAEPSVEWWEHWDTVVGDSSPPPRRIPVDDSMLRDRSFGGPTTTSEDSYWSNPGPKSEDTGRRIQSSSSSSSTSSESSTDSSTSTSSSSSSSTNSSVPPKKACNSQKYLDEIFTPTDAPTHSPSPTNTQMPKNPTGVIPPKSDQDPYSEVAEYPAALLARINKIKDTSKKGYKVKRMIKFEGRDYRLVITADGVVKVSLRTSAATANRS